MIVPTNPPIGDDAGEAADVQAAFAATLVDEWVRAGVTHAVVCPGSRSTPLAVALAGHGALTVHVRLDERSAAFTALGIGAATGRPALVVTTSGTAAVELHPAVVEADLSGVPLIACTADRPPELRDVGAPQTIDQTHLFGRSVRWFADPGVPTPATRGTWRSLASRAVAEACEGSGGPGPVHLNLPFREPLLGDPAAAGGVAPGRSGGRPWHQVVASPSSTPAGWLRSAVDEGLLSSARRGVIVAGAACGDPEDVLGLATALGWPVLAEPRSGLRRPGPGIVACADGILRSPAFVAAHHPEVIVRLGDRWVSKVVTSVLASAVSVGARDILVGPTWRWTDPERNADTVVRSEPGSFCRDAARLVGERDGIGSDGAWSGSWQRAEDAARRVISSVLGAGDTLDEPSLAHRLFARLPPEAVVVVSSSMPVRDLEAYALPRHAPPRVLANRGANGIDGVVSTAIGVAVASGRPTVALVGDLALLHDVSALVHPSGIDADLTVVVADNGGGGIFSFLPPASSLEEATFEQLFGTPQHTDPAAVATGFGWEVDVVGPGPDLGAFEHRLDQRVGAGGLSVIRVGLPERVENVAVHSRINAAIVGAVEATLTAG
jgi:2-succinyl-5-enolpyruvyl-6-hydroxy-3-cyclohexene-1-carboxylate synthase